MPESFPPSFNLLTFPTPVLPQRLCSIILRIPGEGLNAGSRIIRDLVPVPVPVLEEDVDVVVKGLGMGFF